MRMTNNKKPTKIEILAGKIASTKRHVSFQATPTIKNILDNQVTEPKNCYQTGFKICMSVLANPTIFFDNPLPNLKHQWAIFDLANFTD